MNTVSGSQLKDIAQLQANNAERQAIRARLEELDRQDNEILKRVADTEYKETAPTPNFSAYKGKTLFLLLELWNAPSRKLSYKEIREDVMCKEESSIDAVMSFVKRARNEMKSKKDFHYEIENIQEWGYRLLYRESCQILSKPSKTPRKRRKNDRI